MKRILILVLFLPLFVHAQSTAEEQAAAADKAFGQQHYNEAISGFRSVLESGYTSATLYAKLGNACYRQHDLASAILYYEKALRLEPANEDVRYNLQVAMSKISDKIEARPLPFYQQVWVRLTVLFSPSGWAILIIVSLSLLLTATALFLIAPGRKLRRTMFWIAAPMALLLLTSAIAGTSAYRQQQRQDEAIIFAPTVAVKSSPDEKSMDIFVLHEGSKVRINDQIGEWSEIIIANGNSGWVKSSTMKTI